MVWGVISYHTRSRLVVVRGNLTGQCYIDEILAQAVVPFMNANRRLALLQQDSARCHTARICTAYQQQQHVDVLPWPAKSPDLSPIEHLWDTMDRRRRRRWPVILAQLKLFLIQEWYAIPQGDSQNLIRSMRRCCIALRESNGGHTWY